MIKNTQLSLVDKRKSIDSCSVALTRAGDKSSITQIPMAREQMQMELSSLLLLPYTGSSPAYAKRAAAIRIVKLPSIPYTVSQVIITLR